MLDWLFRPQCIACGIPADTLCQVCTASLVELGPACPRCAEPTAEHSTICRRCAQAPLPLERIVAPWRFGGQLAAAIRRLKFGGGTQIARDLAPLWAPLVAAAALGDEPAIVVPVPLHWRRRLGRGYDHTWHLAVHACRSAGISPPIAALRRVRGGAPQSTLSKAARRDNLRGAFVARLPSAITGNTVILIDDVVTTGSTLAAAAGALHAAGATRVIGVAVARATSSP